MKALAKLASGPGNMGIVERPVPPCGSGEVLVEIAAASICGSDVHIFRGEIECAPGVVMGHEFAGRIAAIGPDVSTWRLGDRVTSELHVGACGRCSLCVRGIAMMCPAKTPPGWSSDGAFAPYIKLPARLLHRVPDSVSDSMAALTEPIACSFSAINILGIRPGDFVLVLGTGFIGLASAKIAQALGAGKVAVAGRSRKSTQRLDTARRMGLDIVLDADQDDVLAAVLASSGGQGADVVIEAAGSEQALHIAAHAIRPAGALCAIGLTGKPSVPVEWDLMMRRRLRVAFAWSADSEAFEQSLHLLARQKISFPPDMIASFGLERWREAFEAIEDRQAVKAQLVPGPTRPSEASLHPA